MRGSKDSYTQIHAANHALLDETLFVDVDVDASPVQDELLTDDRFESRYELRTVIGEGGMGIVESSLDRRIGREIAVKTARAASLKGDARQRFLREARVQGQLEHPAIVPVYDLSRDTTGAPCFTMRRVRGLTLAQILSRLREKDEETVAKYSRRKLLTAFGSVCLAIHYAHTRGVVHRDLKPSNIMLGDFGEVYVLDWGLSKLKKELAAPGVAEVELPPDDVEETMIGELMGTPGYLAPEQAKGMLHKIDARSDVYSLGAILFEIVSFEALHKRGALSRMLRSTLEGAESRFSVRFPDRDLPPELEAICQKATAVESDARFASARELSDAVWSFLDGDRDQERRIVLARRHADTASAHAERAVQGGSGAVDERGHALREVSRALALDPTNDAAMRTMVRLFTEPPKELPPEAEAELEASMNRTMRASTRAGTLAYLSWLGYLPLLAWMGVNDVVAAVVASASWAFALGAGAWIARAKRPGFAMRAAVTVLSTTAIATTSTVFGPFILLPTLAVINGALLAVNSAKAERVATFLFTTLAVFAPVALAELGVIPCMMTFTDGNLVIQPHMMRFPEVPTLVMLLVCTTATLVTSAVTSVHIRASLGRAERRLFQQAWQLRQLFPLEAKEVAKPMQDASIAGRVA